MSLIKLIGNYPLPPTVEQFVCINCNGTGLDKDSFILSRCEVCKGTGVLSVSDFLICKTCGKSFICPLTKTGLCKFTLVIKRGKQKITNYRGKCYCDSCSADEWESCETEYFCETFEEVKYNEKKLLMWKMRYFMRQFRKFHSIRNIWFIRTSFYYKIVVEASYQDYFIRCFHMAKKLFEHHILRHKHHSHRVSVIVFDSKKSKEEFIRKRGWGE